MDTPLNRDLTNFTVATQYKLIKKLGAGAFGEIYYAQKKDSKEEYAIKLERSDCRFPQVFFEAKLYAFLHADSGGDKGIPRIFGSSTEGEYNYMIMEVLGKSIEDLFNNNSRKLSIKTVLMLAEQMVSRIEFVHSKQFIHRDIKPDNFLMGYGNKSHKVYIVDFGLAKRYMIKEGHIPYKENKSLTGTVRYASINTHLGIEQSRRDDLEALGYVLVYLLKGTLPWMNIKATNQKDKYEKILEKKMQTNSEILCKGLPYVKALKFEEKPDYSYMRGLFKDMFTRQGFELDYRYDWIKPNEKVNVTIEKNNRTQPILQTQEKASPEQKPIAQAAKEPENKIKPQGAQPQPLPQIPKPKPKEEAKSIKLQKRNSFAAPSTKEKPKIQPRQQSAKKDVKLVLPKQINAPRIVINKEPYQKA